jgi:hypothetical protein
MNWNFDGKGANADANADTYISSFNFVIWSVKFGGLVGKTLAPKPSGLSSNLRPRVYDFSPFPPYLLSFVTFKRSFILI